MALEQEGLPEEHDPLDGPDGQDGPDGLDEATAALAQARVEQARDLLRTQEPPGWPAVAQGTAERLRSVVRPGQQVEVWRARPGEPPGSRLAVSTRVLLPRLRSAVQTPELAGDVAVEAIDLDLDHGRLRAVRVDLVGRFGIDLAEAGERASDAVQEVLDELLDAGTVGSPSISVRVTDVVDGDPRLV